MMDLKFNTLSLAHHREALSEGNCRPLLSHYVWDPKAPSEAKPIMELSQHAGSGLPIHPSSSVSYPHTNYLHSPNKEANMQRRKWGENLIPKQWEIGIKATWTHKSGDTAMGKPHAHTGTSVHSKMNSVLTQAGCILFLLGSNLL